MARHFPPETGSAGQLVNANFNIVTHRVYVTELTDLKLASETPQIAQISHLVEIRATFGPTNCQDRRFIKERVFYEILRI